MSKPPRPSLSIRNMLMALGVLMVIALVGGVTRSCSFSPGGPTIDQSAAPVIDAPAALTRLNKDVAFPVRIPAVPAEWRANTSGLDDVGTAKAARVGYLTTQRHYLRLLQSDAPEDQLLQLEATSGQAGGAAPVDVAGQKWTAYAGGSNGAVEEPIWIADLGTVRIVITGSGNDAEYRQLATAVTSAAPLGK